MIFSGGLADKVLDGSKTQTRRPAPHGRPCQYRVGQSYAIQRKRGTHGLGPRILVLSVDRVRVSGISVADAVAEGFEQPADFEALWHSFYGDTYGWCWRIEFAIAEPS